MHGALRGLDPELPTELDLGDWTEGPEVEVATLTNLAEGCAEGCALLVRSSDGLGVVRGLIDGSMGGHSVPTDVRMAAAILLLALCDAAAPSRRAVLDAGGRLSLEAIANASWSTEVASARAKQALRELA